MPGDDPAEGKDKAAFGQIPKVELGCRCKFCGARRFTTFEASEGLLRILKALQKIFVVGHRLYPFYVRSLAFSRSKRCKCLSKKAGTRQVPTFGACFVRADSQPTLKSAPGRSEEHTSELQSLMRISYAVFCLKKQT